MSARLWKSGTWIQYENGLVGVYSTVDGQTTEIGRLAYHGTLGKVINLSTNCIHANTDSAVRAIERRAGLTK